MALWILGYRLHLLSFLKRKRHLLSPNPIFLLFRSHSYGSYIIEMPGGNLKPQTNVGLCFSFLALTLTRPLISHDSAIKS